MSYLPPPSTLPPGSIVDSYRRDSGGMKQDQSTDQQLAEISAFCELHGLILRHNFVDDAKSGGSTEGRDQFKRMIDSFLDADQRPSGIILWNYARFARDIDDAQLHKINIRRLGIVIHSLNDQVPEGNYGRFVEFFIDMSNEEKRHQTSIDAKRGLRDLVQKYGCVPGTPPRGFMREEVYIGERRDKTQHVAHKWVPDPAFKTRVKKAFQMRAEGKPLKEIHEETHLYNSSNSYLTFFTNPLYKGELHYADLVIPAYCKPMVSVEIWNKVQLIVAELSQRQKVRSTKRDPRRQSGTYLLSGIAKCGLCQSPLCGHTTYQVNGNAYLRYVCTQKKRRHDCESMPIPAKQFEEAVIDKVAEFFSDPQNLINMLTAYNSDIAGSQSQVDEEHASLSAQLASVRKTITNLTNAISEAGHSSAILKKLSASETLENELLSKISVLRSRVTPQAFIPKPEQIKTMGEKIKKDLKSEDRAFVRRVLLGFIEQVISVREKERIRVRMVMFYAVQGKNNMPTSAAPVGAPICRHTVNFEIKCAVIKKITFK